MNHPQNHIDTVGTANPAGQADEARQASDARQAGDASHTPELLELLSLQAEKVDTRAVERRALKRIASGEAAPRGARGSLPFRSRKALLLVAVVALLVVGMGSAFATNALLGYFYPQELGRPSGAPSFYGTQTPNLEDYSVAVGQRLEAEGVAVTLDTIASDGNIVTAFLTYEYDEPVILGDAVIEGYDPLDAVAIFTAHPQVSVNGQQLSGTVPSSDAKDSQAYFADDEQRVIKKAVQYLIPTTSPNTLEVAVTVEPFTSNHVFVSAVPETLAFSPVTVDISAALSQTISVEPGQYRFTIDGVERTLDLAKLSVGPLGSVISVYAYPIDGERNPAYFDLHEFLIVDQNGTTLGVTAPGSAMQGELHSGYLRDVPAGLTSLSLVPPLSNDVFESRSYSTDAIGATIEIMPNGGFYLRDYKVEGSSITFTAEAYGEVRERGILGEDGTEGRTAEEWAAETRLYNPDFSPNEGTIPPQELGGVLSTTYDEATGIYTYRIDFYTATEDLLRQITSFSVAYDPGDIGYDYDQAYVLPLR